MSNGSTKFKNSINLEPQSADPSSPAEGDQFFSDGPHLESKSFWCR